MAHQTFRDRYGIPYLRADSTTELAFAQGRNAALDRAWQLTYARWRARGESAARIGASAVPWDRFAHRSRIADTARRAFARLPDTTRDWISAYVAGVNAGLPEGARHAVELRSLAVPADPWEEWMPLGVFLAQHLVFGTIGYKLGRRFLRSRLGPDVARLFRLEGNASAGSNAWALTGRRTAGGRPLLAGDPHRPLEQPGTYQQVRLAGPDFDVAGLAFPGVPGLPHFGHAGSVAWVITNAMADYQDLYVETDEPALVDEVRLEVRHAPAETLPITETPRGPVIGRLADGSWLSLRVPSRVLEDAGFGCLLPLLRSRSVVDVDAALQGWVEPVNSLLTADVSGAVRHLVVGRVPLRHSDNQIAPVPADAAHAWTGWADPVSEPLPEGHDVAVNANDRPSGGGLGYDYAPPHRARRIRALLGNRTGLTTADMTEIHRDTRHPGARRMRELLAGAPTGPVRAELLAWDGRADLDSTGMARFAAWRHALVAWLIRQPPLAVLTDPATPDDTPPLFAPYASGEVRISGAWERLTAADNPLGLDLSAGVAYALAAAAQAPVRTWGEIHTLDPLHGLVGVIGHEPRLSRHGVPGDTGCVCTAASTPGISDECVFGAVARYVFDLADRGAGGWVVPFGASGRADSPHAGDQDEAYVAGRLVPIVDDWTLLAPDPDRPAGAAAGGDP